MTMTIEEAIASVNEDFIYEKDSSNYILPESWRLLDADGHGDCEDYSLEVIYRFGGSSFLTLIKNLAGNQFKLHHCKTKWGVTHLITEYKNDTMAESIFFDNIHKRPLSRADVDAYGYQLKFRWFFTFMMIKLLLGYTLGTVGKILKG